MNKKKILTLCLVACLAITAIAGASLAYFTDTDSANNTFTVGNVDIKLVEKQTENSVLSDFVQDKALAPGQETSKLVMIENTGKNDAWVWVDMYIPEGLALQTVNTKATNVTTWNALHYGTYGYFDSRTQYYHNPNYTTSLKKDGIFDADGNYTIANMQTENNGWQDFVYVDTANGYVHLRSWMVKPLESGKISAPALRTLTLCGFVSCEVDENGNTTYKVPVPDVWTSTNQLASSIKGYEDYTGAFEVKIEAYAIQKDGFDNIDDAIKAYSNPTHY